MHLRFHRGTQTASENGRRENHSVHVLNDEDDLRAALQRAAEYDQRTADMLLSRSAHYRALLAQPADGAAAE
jgi:glucose-6-phosphate dehydrogenase assembly protein OpcA